MPIRLKSISRNGRLLLVIKKMISTVGDFNRIVIFFYMVLIRIHKTFANLTMVKNIMKISPLYTIFFMQMVIYL